MPRGDIEQTDNLPLIVARHHHAPGLQSRQQFLGLLQALTQHRMQRPLPVAHRQRPMVFKNFTPWVAMKGQYQVRILSDHAVP